MDLSEEMLWQFCDHTQVPECQEYVHQCREGHLFSCIAVAGSCAIAGAAIGVSNLDDLVNSEYVNCYSPEILPEKSESDDLKIDEITDIKSE